jgi:hypothetical protein
MKEPSQQRRDSEGRVRKIELASRMLQRFVRGPEPIGPLSICLVEKFDFTPT